MNIILLSGGSGKRLWPLSNEIRSKQFLQFLTNEAGEKESMVQRVYRQIKEADVEANIVVATAQTQVDSLQNQLGKKVQVVIEPKRRDTFPAIALSCCYLALEEKRNLEETVVVLPVDPFAELEFFRILKKMDWVIQEKKANLALMGIEPTYPSQKYGYIGKETNPLQDYQGKKVYPVTFFQEKPTEEEAKGFIEQGAFWNAGVFAFSLGYMMELVKNYMQPISYAAVRKEFERFPQVSFDKEIVEREKTAVMLPYEDEKPWKDLGTWNTLSEQMDEAGIGYVITGEGTCNTQIINELSIPMVVLGAKDMIVAASPDGILVSDKHKSSYIKPYVDGLNERPMFEERRWGDYKVLDYVTYEDGTQSLTKHLHMNEQESISYQSHQVRDEIWTIVDGEGLLVIEGKQRQVRRGDIAYIKKGEKHALKALTSLHFIEVQIGEELVEEDIKRYEWIW